LLEVRGLYFRHGGEADVLRGISLEARGGEITTVLGPNGCGKTTLFKCIGGIWRPQKGTVTLSGEDMLGLSHTERARLLATVPQEHEAAFPYSVFDMVLMGRASRIGALSTPSRQDHRRADEALSEAGIGDLRNKTYTKLSGGEKQLVFIARALAQDAAVLLLDEPVSHLDFRHQILILRKIRDLTREKNLVTLMTLHDPNLSMLFSDRVILMNGGIVVEGGNPEAVITEDNLKEVYGIDVRIMTSNGYRLVYARTYDYDTA